MSRRATTIIAVVLLAALLMPLAVFAGNAPIPGKAIKISDIRLLVNQVVQTLITVAALAVVGFIIYGGMMMAMSAGNEAKFKSGRDIVRNAIIGGVIIFGVGVIVSTISRFSRNPTTINRIMEPATVAGVRKGVLA